MSILLTLLPLFTVQDDHESSASVAKAYIEEVMVKRDYEAAEFLTQEDMFFIDPSAHLLKSGLHKGLRGSAAIVRMMQGFGLSGVSMQPKYEFSSGPYFCFIGSFSCDSPTPGQPTRFPFSTILKVEDGLVSERTDFGDYDVFLPEDQRIDGIEGDLGHPNVLAARAYIKAYAARDFKAMAALRSEQSSFQDRTAVVIGSGAEIKGNANITHFLQAAIANLNAFDIQTDYSFFHGDFAYFAGQVSYTFPGSQLGLAQELFSVQHALAVVLHFKDGKILRHDDLADYDGYAQQVAAARSGKR